MNICTVPAPFYNTSDAVLLVNVADITVNPVFDYSFLDLVECDRCHFLFAYLAIALMSAHKALGFTIASRVYGFVREHFYRQRFGEQHCIRKNGLKYLLLVGDE